MLIHPVPAFTEPHGRETPGFVVRGGPFATPSSMIRRVRAMAAWQIDGPGRGSVRRLDTLGLWRLFIPSSLATLEINAVRRGPVHGTGYHPS